MSPNRILDFQNQSLKPEKLIWQSDSLGSSAVTTLGTYWILKGGYLSFQAIGSPVSEHLGRFKHPKRVARRHFNEEA